MEVCDELSASVSLKDACLMKVEFSFSEQLPDTLGELDLEDILLRSIASSSLHKGGQSSLGFLEASRVRCRVGMLVRFKPVEEHGETAPGFLCDPEISRLRVIIESAESRPLGRTRAGSVLFRLAFEGPKGWQRKGTAFGEL